MLLSDFLRHVLGATGTHVGCEHGVCGCCTVLIDGTAVRSCLTLAVQAEGRAVTTVEALADGSGKLNALQQAFQNNHALQCGFCTPGILMSFTDFLARNPDPSEAEVVEVLSGHLCRCTGYAGIVAAVLEAAGGKPTTRPEPSVQSVEPDHHCYRLADHDRFRSPHHPRCGDRGGQGQDRRHRQVRRDRRALLRSADRRRPPHRGDARLHRLPFAFLVPALARPRRRGQCAVVPVRPHVPLRGRARGRRRADFRDPGGGRAAQARRHLLHRSRQLSSRGLGRRDHGDRHPRHRLALVVRSHQVGARHPAGADDRIDGGGVGARRNGARALCQIRQCRGSAPAPRSAASTTPPTS